MAKLILTFLLFSFFVVSFSHARDLSARSEDEVSVLDSAVEDSDSKASIFLPSEKLSEESIAEPDQVRTIEFNPSEITAAETTETGSDRLVVITFRPINRQLVRRPVPLMFRQGRRSGCRHHHNSKPWRLADPAGQISYGNDMIVSDERSSLDSGVSVGNWGSDREIAIPSRLNEFRHVGPWDSSDGKEDRKHLHHHRFHQHREEEEHEHREKSGFLRNFRKFLNQFEF